MNLQGVFPSSKQVLIFSVADEKCGLVTGRLSKLFEPGHIEPVPGSPPFIRGVTAYRGKVVTLVDPQVLLGAEGTAEEELSVALIKTPFDHIGVLIRGKTEIRNVVWGQRDSLSGRADSWRININIQGTGESVVVLEPFSLAEFMETITIFGTIP